MFKSLIVINLVLILISLFSGAFFLSRDKQGGNRVLTSLKLRVALSICLIVMVISGYFMGLISPNPF
ncbi:MAG TPA: DUF2909 domain-containing protein [Gammaproteobacteria bacterium]|nr:DUF2909 domain-containing protein [Gammaproteobacteria bacterium]